MVERPTAECPGNRERSLEENACRGHLYTRTLHSEWVIAQSLRWRSALTRPKPTLSELQTKLDSVRREVRNLTVMGMDSSQPADQAALIKELERSARAEQRLRKMALDYAKGELRYHRRQKRKT